MLRPARDELEQGGLAVALLADHGQAVGAGHGEGEILKEHAQVARMGHGEVLHLQHQKAPFLPARAAHAPKNALTPDTPENGANCFAQKKGVEKARSSSRTQTSPPERFTGCVSTALLAHLSTPFVG